MLRFGTMRGLVDGLEAVLPDGTIHDGLSGLKKDSRGYSLDQLLIGAEGRWASPRRSAVPGDPFPSGGLACLTSPQAALDVLRAVQGQSSRIEGFEILPRESLNAVLGHVPDTRAPLSSDHPWHALVEATADHADAEQPSELLARLLAPLIEQGLVGDATISASEAQAEAFWRIRDSLSEAERAASGRRRSTIFRCRSTQCRNSWPARPPRLKRPSRARMPPVSAISATAISIFMSAPARAAGRTG